MDHDSHDDEAPTEVRGPEPPPADEPTAATEAPAAPTEPAESRLTLSARNVPSETVRILLWTVRLGITLALAGIFAFGGFVLALFGLGGVALLIAALLIAVSAVTWRRGMLPAAVLAAALALPAAQGVLADLRYDRSFGTLIVRPANPAEIAGRDLVRGFGSVLVDLRSFKAPDGSVTDISARSDNNRVVVALPRGRCFNLDIRYIADPGGASGARELLTEGGRLFGVDLGSGETTMVSSTLLTNKASERETQVNTLQLDQSRYNQTRFDGKLDVPSFPLGLNLYGRVPATSSNEIRRPAVGQPNAPTLRLNLRSRQQIVVRDYPENAGPLIEPGMGGSQVADMSWPSGVQPPPSPVELTFDDRPSVRTAANRARWVSWERKMIAWSTAQAKRGAGECASRKELSERGYQFDTQPETIPGKSGGTSEALGGPTTRHSDIAQRTAPNRSKLMTVEVNGLGEVHVLGWNDDPNFTTDENGANG